MVDLVLPGKSHGRRSLEGCSPWGHTESDTTERLHFHFSLSLFTFMHWRRKWQPTPMFLPGESQGQGNLVGCCLWGHTVGHDWSDLADNWIWTFLIFLLLVCQVSNFNVNKNYYIEMVYSILCVPYLHGEFVIGNFNKTQFSFIC